MHHVARCSRLRTLGCALLFGAAACDTGPTDPPPQQLTDISSVLALAGAASATFRPPGEFHHEIDCPAGGRIILDDEYHTVTEETAGRLRIEWKSRMRFDACAVRSESTGSIGRTDGEMAITGFARFAVPGESGGLMQLIENETRQVGRLTWSADGQSRSCDIDLTMSVDMVRRVARMKGTRCGERIDAEHRLPDYVR